MMGDGHKEMKNKQHFEMRRISRKQDFERPGDFYFDTDDPDRIMLKFLPPNDTVIEVKVIKWKNRPPKSIFNTKLWANSMDKPTLTNRIHVTLSDGEHIYAVKKGVLYYWCILNGNDQLAQGFEDKQ